jgi:hypothetical protein
VSASSWRWAAAVSERRGEGPWAIVFTILLVVGAKPAADAATPPHRQGGGHQRTQPEFFGGAPRGPASGDVVRLALAQAKRMHASPKVTLALVEAGIVESHLRNLPYGDRDSLGYLQQRPSQGWRCPRNITCATWDFLRRAIPIERDYSTAGRLAQAVQLSAFPDRYDRAEAAALAVIGAYQRGGR